MTNIKWLELLYPPRCLVCDRVLITEETRICRCCQRKGLPERIREPLCKCCGKPVQKEEKEYCLDCSERTHAFLQGRAVFAYRGMEEAMHRFKDGNRREYQTFFGEVLAETICKRLPDWCPDMILPIPLTPQKKRKRGYNQAELLGNALSEQLKIPSRADLLIRRRGMTEQKELDAAMRRQNLKNAFAVTDPREIMGKRILLADDIYTTGSTIDAAAGVLVKSGAKAVFYAAVCIGKGD